MNLSGVAQALGLSLNSASSVSAWEQGQRQPSLRQLAQLAILYDVPFGLFTDPPATDEERLLAIAGDQPVETAEERGDEFATG